MLFRLYTQADKMEMSSTTLGDRGIMETEQHTASILATVVLEQQQYERTTVEDNKNKTSWLNIV